MEDFLKTYKNKLQEKNITTVKDEEQRAVLSAVVQQLRNQSINNRLCRDNNVNDLVVTEVDSAGFVIEVRCKKCQKTMQTPFLHTYKELLRQRNITTLNVKDLPNVLSAVVQQIRNQSTNNQLCCDNNVNDLVVTAVASDGFVTQVRCNNCRQTMQTSFLHTYKEILRQNEIATLNVQDLPNILSAVVQQLRNQSNNKLCCDDDENDLAVTDVDRHGFVTEVRCEKCQQTMKTPFLHTYKQKLREKSIDTLNVKDLPTILSAVVLLLRRHSITGTTCNNRLCCGNHEDDLTVTDVDRYGFVTEVTCKKCTQSMKTTCHNSKWTYERIYDESQLNPGDHIRWHRPMLYWHHAIVTAVNPIKIIHYSDDLTVQKDDISNAHVKQCRFLDALYRISYQDCYDAHYTIRRAEQLLNRSSYQLLEENCEHFSRWCKTGSTNSSQVMSFWASLGQGAITIGIRVIALIILSLIAYSHELAEESVRNRKQLESLERGLTTFFMAVITLIFITYSMITYCSRIGLDQGRRKMCDIENPCECSGVYNKCTDNRSTDRRRCCCLTCCCFSFFCRAPISLTLSVCKNITRRPPKLVLGLLCRILCRELLPAVPTTVVLWMEETITDSYDIAQLSAEVRTLVLMAISVAVYIVGYIISVFLGRLIEAIFEFEQKKPNNTQDSQLNTSRNVMTTCT